MVLYAKYNSLRQPQYQVETRIVESKGQQWVEKRALCPEAKRHIDNILLNYEKLLGHYGERIVPVGCEKMNDTIQFAYIDGAPLIDSRMLKNMSVDDIVELVKKTLQLIMGNMSGEPHAFSMSDDFCKLFPDCEPMGMQSYDIANMDAIFSNFVVSENQVYCIDYEWIFDFDIPMEYLEYRAVLYFYRENICFLRDRVTKNDFLVMCGIREDDIPLFEKMEYCFQELVHGKETKYIYTERYKKPVETVEELRGIIRDKEVHIQNLTAMLEKRKRYISHLKSAIKNPKYGVELLKKKRAGTQEGKRRG